MRRSMVVLFAILVAVLCLSANVAFGKKPSSEPGKQTITARWTDTPADADGVIGPGEYSAAIPVHVKFNKPTTAPGIVPDWMSPPDNQDDLSYTIYAMYDENSLYIAVDVADDIIWDDSPFDAPWHDDDVDIYIDGDEVRNDCQAGDPGREGFQLCYDVGGDALAYDGGPFGGYSISPSFMFEWEAAPGLRPRGYVVEFRIALSSIDVTDGEGEAPPGPGSSVGFNVTVGDDDNGGGPYEVPEDSFGAWDGRSSNWWFAREDDWGTLYFAPRPKGKAKKPALSLRSSTWGQVKSLLK